jgi:hypothetical protein
VPDLFIASFEKLNGKSKSEMVYSEGRLKPVSALGEKKIISGIKKEHQLQEENQNQEMLLSELHPYTGAA